MKISVAMCTYNGERFLSEQAESFLAQTRKPDQIIINDDASRDETWTFLQSFAERAGAMGIEVKLHRNSENLGYIRNFESALQRTSGDLVFLCDQDDIWLPDKVAAFCAEFERRPDLGLLHSDARLIDDDGCDIGYSLFDALEMTRRERTWIHQGDALAALLPRNLATGATMAFRRDVMLAALPIAEGWFHDEWLALVAALISRVDCLETPSIAYRQHGANQVGARRRTKQEKKVEASKPRREVMYHIAGRAERLYVQAEERRLPLSPARLHDLRGHIRHKRSRAQMSRLLVIRLPVVLREILRGRYWRYSSGFRSIARDMLGF